MHFKDIIESARLDIALEKCANESDLKPHIIYVGHKFYENQNMLHTLVLEQLKNHAIESAMITNLLMYKNYLMTKEKMEDFFDLKRYFEDMWVPRDSINDNLENFVEDLCHEKEQEHSSKNYFVAKLTEEEMELFKNKNKEHMKTYFCGSFSTLSDTGGPDVSVEEMKLSESKYVNAQCWRTSSVVKNYELSEDNFYHYEFVNRRDDGAVQHESTIQVCFRKRDMSCNEMESLAGWRMGNRHAWAIQTIKYLHQHNPKFMELNKFLETLFQKDNPFHKKIVEQNWQEARIVLHTSLKGGTEFHRLLIEEKMEFDGKNLLLWLLLCYLSYKFPRSYPKTWS